MLATRLLTYSLILVLPSACLSQSHVIPPRELHRLAVSDPATRGERVRVVQGWYTESDPAEAPNATSQTFVALDLSLGPTHAGGPPPPRGPQAPGPAGPKPGLSSSSKASSEADDAYWLVIAAVAVGVGLAVTEGVRYDGWVRLHPMHPVHLWGPNGEYTWLPLSQLTPATADWARKALVRPSEGPWQTLGRAPLGRAGFTYGFTLGAAQMPSVYDTLEIGFQSHIKFGFFLS